MPFRNFLLKNRKNLLGWIRGKALLQTHNYADPTERPVIISFTGINMYHCRGKIFLGVLLLTAKAELIRTNKIKVKEEFLWVLHMGTPPIRNRVQLPNASRKIKFIAPEEIEAALVRVVKDAIAIREEDAIGLSARLFGFNRVTEEMKEEVLVVLNEMISQNKFFRDNHLIKLV